jgi:hypothetical protein
VGGILSPAPLDLVDLLLDLQRLEVVELGFVGLEFGVELVLASLFLFGLSVGKRDGWARRRATCRLVPLKENDATTFVASCQIVARVVKLDCGDDIRCSGLRQLMLRSGYVAGGREHKPSVMSSTSPLSPKHL